MKFIAFIKSDASAEAGEAPDEKFMTGIGTFNQKLLDAGVMVGGEGLHPSSAGARINFSESGVSVTRGPFPDPTQLVAGYWLLECSSLDEAVNWMKECPTPEDPTMEIEVRQLFSDEDFAAAQS
jgi:hypothetical protein